MGCHGDPIVRAQRRGERVEQEAQVGRRCAICSGGSAPIASVDKCRRCIAWALEEFQGDDGGINGATEIHGQDTSLRRPYCVWGNHRHRMSGGGRNGAHMCGTSQPPGSPASGAATTTSARWWLSAARAMAAGSVDVSRSITDPGATRPGETSTARAAGLKGSPLIAARTIRGRRGGRPPCFSPLAPGS